MTEDWKTECAPRVFEQDVSYDQLAGAPPRQITLTHHARSLSAHIHSATASVQNLQSLQQSLQSARSLRTMSTCGYRRLSLMGQPDDELEVRRRLKF